MHDFDTFKLKKTNISNLNNFVRPIQGVFFIEKKSRKKKVNWLRIKIHNHSWITITLGLDYRYTAQHYNINIYTTLQKYVLIQLT